MKEKRGQLKLSFGMIFSIILIIAFLVFAFYAIQKLLSAQSSLKESQFIDNLQNDVDTLWKSSQGSQENTYSLNKGIEKVCFIDDKVDAKGKDQQLYADFSLLSYGGDNMIFYPLEESKIGSVKIDHIDVIAMTEQDNPTCFNNVDGKVSLTVEKQFGDALVQIR